MKFVAEEPVSTGVCAAPPMNGVTRYPVIGLPPFEAGAVQVRLTDAFPGVPETLVGAPGSTAVPAGAATLTSSKSVVKAPSFQSCRRWKFALRV